MLVVILADTRVGSTALGTALENLPHCHFLGEILYPEVADRPDHLYGRLLDKSLGTFLNAQSLASMLNEFFDPLIADGNVVTTVDIKYHDLKVIPAHPSGLDAIPPLLRYFTGKQVPIIHLNRQNKLAAALSELSAQHRGTHHVFLETADEEVRARNPAIAPSLNSSAGSSPERAPRKIAVSAYDLVASTLEREAAHRTVRKWLRDYPQAFEVEYEALFLHPTGIEQFLRHLREKWQLTELAFDPKLARLAKADRFAIENFDALLRLFHGTPWSAWLPEIAELYGTDSGPA